MNREAKQTKSMPEELERDLGLASVVAISMGAMIGSGIFILPGLATAEAGPAVILAFVIAAVLVLPAAVSSAELGTAMPEAGGDYIFIERGMGPGAGTIVLARSGEKTRRSLRSAIIQRLSS